MNRDKLSVELWLNDLFEILLVFFDLLLPIANQGVEHFRHLLIVHGVGWRFFDDDAAQVVFDGFGHRVLAVPYLFR